MIQDTEVLISVLKHPCMEEEKQPPYTSEKMYPNQNSEIWATGSAFSVGEVEVQGRL